MFPFEHGYLFKPAISPGYELDEMHEDKQKKTNNFVTVFLINIASSQFIAPIHSQSCLSLHSLPV